MNVLVCGGRDYANYDKLKNVLNTLSINLIVHSGATNVDKMADKYANENNIPVQVYYADWYKYGRMAGVIRNKQMLENEQPDVVVACLGGLGTRHMINLARSLHIDVIEVD